MPKSSMISLPRKLRGSSSSELSEPESSPTQLGFSATSPMRDTPSPREEAPTTSHSMVTRSKHQLPPSQRQATRQNAPSSSKEISTASHRMETRSRNQAQATQQQSPPGRQATPSQLPIQSSQEEILRQQSIPTLQRLSPPQQDTSTQEGTFIQQQFDAWQTRIPTPQQLQAPLQAPSTQQQSSSQQKVAFPPDQFYSNQERPAQFDLGTVDPLLRSSIFLEADPIDLNRKLALDPVLLNTGKPIRIPIREFRDFRPFDTFHEEPSDLALSDNEAEVDAQVKIKNLSIGGKKAAHQTSSLRKPRGRPRKIREPYKERDFTKSREPNKDSVPIKEGEFTDEQIRFMILMRVYWGMAYNEVAEAWSREFGGDSEEDLSANQIAKRLAAVKGDLKFEEYRLVMENARLQIHEPEGLNQRLLWEAKGFLARLKKD